MDVADFDDDELLDSGLRRVRDRRRAGAARVEAAREAVRRAGASRPDDLAAPSDGWHRELAAAVDVLLNRSWKESGTSPDGLAHLLLTATEHGLQIDADVYLLPDGLRPVRLLFDEAGNCVLHVAAPSESSPKRRRLDPRRPMRWAYTVEIENRPSQ